MVDVQTEFLTGCRFYLSIQLLGSDGIDAYFLECRGFKISQDVVDICEVTSEPWGNASKGRIRAMKIPGNVKVNNIILRRGLSTSQALWQWYSAVQEYQWGNYRSGGSIVIYNQASEPQAEFQFDGAWPCSYSFPDVDANSTDFAIEELELACEVFERVR